MQSKTIRMSIKVLCYVVIHNVPQSGTYRARRSCVYRLKSIAGKQIHLPGHPEWACCQVPPAPEPCISSGRKPTYRARQSLAYRQKLIAGTNNPYSHSIRVGALPGGAAARISTEIYRRNYQSMFPFSRSGRIARCRRHPPFYYYTR